MCIHRDWLPGVGVALRKALPTPLLRQLRKRAPNTPIQAQTPQPKRIATGHLPESPPGDVQVSAASAGAACVC